jgi:hypothetical protein
MLRRVMLLTVLVAGVFWLGRESTHGVHAFYEHWWCVGPFLLVGIALVGWFWDRQRGVARP